MKTWPTLKQFSLHFCCHWLFDEARTRARSVRISLLHRIAWKGYDNPEGYRTKKSEGYQAERPKKSAFHIRCGYTNGEQFSHPWKITPLCIYNQKLIIFQAIHSCIFKKSMFLFESEKKSWKSAKKSFSIFSFKFMWFFFLLRFFILISTFWRTKSSEDYPLKLLEILVLKQ